MRWEYELRVVGRATACFFSRSNYSCHFENKTNFRKEEKNDTRKTLPSKHVSLGVGRELELAIRMR